MSNNQSTAGASYILCNAFALNNASYRHHRIGTFAWDGPRKKFSHMLDHQFSLLLPTCQSYQPSVNFPPFNY